MAELPPEEIVLMMQAFTRAYNARNSTDFKYDDQETKQNNAAGPNRDLSVDYICTSATANDKLRIQHTEAWSHRDHDRFWVRRVEVVRAGMESQLASLAGGPHQVMLRMAKAPKSQEARKVVRGLWDEVQGRARELPTGAEIRWSPTPGIREYVSSVTLARPVRPDRGPIVIAGPAKSRLDAVGQRARLRLEWKATRYGPSGEDLLLLIDYRVTTYDAGDLPEIIESVSGISHPFREVWTYCARRAGEPLVHIVWPRPAEQD